MSSNHLNLQQSLYWFLHVHSTFDDNIGSREGGMGDSGGASARKVTAATTSEMKGRIDGSSCKHIDMIPTAWFKLVNGKSSPSNGSTISLNLFGSLKYVCAYIWKLMNSSSLIAYLHALHRWMTSILLKKKTMNYMTKYDEI